MLIKPQRKREVTNKTRKLFFIKYSFASHLRNIIFGHWFLS